MISCTLITDNGVISLVENGIRKLISLQHLSLDLYEFLVLSHSLRNISCAFDKKGCESLALANFGSLKSLHLGFGGFERFMNTINQIVTKR